MNTSFTPERSDAIRSMLVARAARRRAPRALASIALVAAGLLVGSAVAAAAFSWSAPTELSGVPAPAGVIPGAPIISLLGAPTSQIVRGDADIPLGDPPTGATRVRVTSTCLTAGATSWGFEARGNNPISSCSGDQIESTSWFDFALDGDTISIGASDETESLVTIQFLNYVETAWGVNARGETFGVSKEGLGDPDLVAVALAASDEIGYARHSDLDAFGPEWPDQPSNPTQALAWQEERDARYPNGWDIPVYASDGVTKVGLFHIGG